MWNIKNPMDLLDESHHSLLKREVPRPTVTAGIYSFECKAYAKNV